MVGSVLCKYLKPVHYDPKPRDRDNGVFKVVSIVA
jgi:hypothetical protein